MAPKKIVVFGASGLVGKLLVQQASERGLDVTAVARSAKGLGFENLPGVKVMEGNLSDARFVETCIEGKDVVLSSLGFRLPGLAYWNHPYEPDYLGIAADNILAAMRKYGVKRVLFLSAAGIGNSYDKIGFGFKAFLNLSALAHVYPLLEKVEDKFNAANDLEVCCPRPPGLTTGPLKGAVTVKPELPGLPQISRADLAKYMLDEAVKDGPFEHKLPLISY